MTPCQPRQDGSSLFFVRVVSADSSIRLESRLYPLEPSHPDHPLRRSLLSPRIINCRSRPAESADQESDWCEEMVMRKDMGVGLRTWVLCAASADCFRSQFQPQVKTNLLCRHLQKNQSRNQLLLQTRSDQNSLRSRRMRAPQRPAKLFPLPRWSLRTTIRRKSNVSSNCCTRRTAGKCPICS